jgi:thioredoxin 1
MDLILKQKSKHVKINFLIFLLFSLSQNIFCQIISLEPKSFKNQLKSTPNVLLLDVRKESQFEKGHISKARNLVYENQEFDKTIENISKETTIFMYCQNGELSNNAGIYMQDLGYKSIFVLSGGFENWIRTPLPYVANSAKFEPLAFYSITDIENLSRKYPLLLLDFYATWCKPCKQQEPILKDLNEKYPNLKIIKIDGDKNQTLSAHFEVEEIPTLILFKNNKQFWRKSGLTKRKQIEALL